MRYRVTFVDFPGPEKAHKRVTIDEVLELMTKFKNDHPGCYMLLPVTGMTAKENGNIHGLIIEREEG